MTSRYSTPAKGRGEGERYGKGVSDYRRRGDHRGLRKKRGIVSFFPRILPTNVRVQLSDGKYRY